MADLLDLAATRASISSSVTDFANNAGQFKSQFPDLKSIPGLPNAGVPGVSTTLGNSATTTTPSQSNALKAQQIGKSQQQDTRVRLRAQDAVKNSVYGPAGTGNLLNILYETNGVIFPYTPVMNWNQPVDYQTLQMTHTNQDFLVYQRTPSTEIALTGDFTVQNQREGVYSLAVIHFLRTVSKMYFGEQSGQKAGLPPPVLLLSGYGTYMFNDLRVILKNHSYTFDKNVSHVDVRTKDGLTRIPSLFTITINVVVQNTPLRQRKEFNLDQFRTGALMTKKGWI